MAGHSKYANIKHRKAAQDAKRTKIFTKVARQITIAAKLGGSDINMNPSLRLAISKAKYVNLPKDKIEKAIKVASGNDIDSNYDDIKYEAYAPYNVAMIVTALTNNKNRTASEVRTAFSKNGGNVGVDGSVVHMFTNMAMFQYEHMDYDKALEIAIECGASDVEEYIDEEEESMTRIFCDAKDFATVRDKISEKLADPIDSRLIWKPNYLVDINSEQSETIYKIIDALNESDDVQYVDHNFRVVD